MNAHPNSWKRTVVCLANVVAALALRTGVASAQAAPTAEPPSAPVDRAGVAEPAAPAPKQPAQAGASASASDAASAERAPTVSEADVAAIVNDTLGSADSPDGESFTPSLRLYGFMDATVTSTLWISNKEDRSATDAFLGPGISFRVGNINLYADATLTDKLRSMAEIRFSYLPNGSLDTLTLKRTRSTPADYTQTYRPVSVGGVIIERAYFEYAAHSLFKLRVGHFISPVGIWNVDHSTVVIVPIGIPYPVGEGFIPLSQTGLEAFGSADVGDFTLGYDLTVSNGRGSASEYLDLDKNKGLGARVYTAYHGGLGTASLGVSGYKGRATYSDVAPSSIGSLSQAITLQYDEVAGGVDFLWKWEGFHLQSEFLISQVAFTDAGRARSVIPTMTSGLVPDFTRFGLYVLAGYRFKWLGVMPYLEFNYHDTGYQLPPPTFNDVTIGRIPAYIAGINIRPIPTFVFKVEALMVDFKADDGLGTKEGWIGSLFVQTAWSF